MRKLLLLLLGIGCLTASAQQLPRKPLPPRPAPGGAAGMDDTDAQLMQSARDLGETLGQGLGLLLSSGGGWDSFCNRIDAGLGWGVDYGGLGLKINYQAPAAFGVTAGFGYNTGYGSHPGDDRKWFWNAGLQLWCTDHWNWEFGVGPRYFKKFDDTQLGISMLTHYQHQIWGRLGAIGGIGFSLSTKTPDGFKKGDVAVRFEWNVGLVFRLFSD